MTEKNEKPAKNQEIELLKAIVKAALTQSEIALLHHFMMLESKKMTENIGEMAKSLGVAQPNLTRTLKSLKAKNVISEKTNGQLYVRSKTKWKSVS